jgi:hypothetical protein
VEQIETDIRAAHGGVYFPDEYATTPPTSVSEVLLPDLHTGAGGAQRTHTNRQIIHNRLFSLLMNRLAANYMKAEIPSFSEPFKVKIDGSNAKEEPVMFPSEFIKALIRSGHKVRTRSSVRVTTFGFALSVKEAPEGDDAAARWIHIPLAMPLRSGIQSSKGKPIPGYLTHGCTDYTVSGPLLQDILVESYHNQEGFAGWGSGHYNDLPWMYGCQSQELDPVRATEVTTLLFTCINSIANRMNLPNGGYGTVGVCNDSSAIVEATVRGQTDIYPLVHIGGFFYQVVNRAEELIENIRKNPKDFPPTALDEAKKLYKAMMDAPNDIHPVPRTIPSTVRRILASMPERPQFVEMQETIRILKEEFPVMKK